MLVVLPNRTLKSVTLLADPCAPVLKLIALIFPGWTPAAVNSAAV